MGTATFTTPGANTWMAPAGVTSVDTVETWASGGGGHSQISGSATGGGGGGGAYSKSLNVAVTSGNNYTATVGTGGASNTDGGDSSFVGDASATTLAKGGKTPTAGSPGGVTGAVGGLASGGTGSTKFDGGTGGNGGSGVGGGGGGSSAGIAANGGTGSNGTGGPTGGAGGTAPSGGGAGGAGATGGNVTGSVGSNPGGGGGGGTPGAGAGGAGANGKVVLTWTDPAVSQLGFQSSQRFDPLPNHNYHWWESNKQGPYVQLVPSPPNPATRQGSQVVIPPLDFWAEWDAYRQRPFAPLMPPPTPPPSRQASQHWDALLDFNTWWEQFRRWPTAPIAMGSPPPSRQSSQRWDALPALDFLWWEQFRKRPLPSYITVAQEGVYGIYGPIGSLTGIGQTGLYRVQNNIEGWNIYVGVGSLPDLTQPPAAFSLTLPISIAVVPPASGTRTYYVLVRKQDTYGLESQNSHYSTITINSSGVFLPSSIPAPQGLSAYQASVGTIRVLASYPTALLDVDPADFWKVWVKATLPNPAIDTPAAIVSVNGQLLSALMSAFAAGVWYVMVGLYRSSDGSLSPILYTIVALTGAPDEVIPVPSGYQSLT